MNFIHALQQALGAGYILTDERAAPYGRDWRARYHGAPLAVACPADTQEVAAVVALCARFGVPLVPQGGNTGLCGGATPLQDGSSVVLSTARLNRVRHIDTDNDTITVEAGCLLQQVQQAAEQAGRLFPLSLAAEGSCTIGGNLATNAGGTQVLRYGNARDLALGLEVVTAEGAIWNGLRGLRKDNTGYDLRDLYIGSEGTLGIITAATLKLYPLPVARCTALLSLDSVEAAVRVLRIARAGFGAALTGFELMGRDCLRAVTRQFSDQRLPFGGDSAQAPWFALLELSDSESEAHARARFETVIEEALTSGDITDAVVAENLAQTKALWRLRESIPMAELALGKSIKHDISVPISRIAAFVQTTNAALAARFPGVLNVIFGHLGDGNLHYNIARGGAGRTEEELLALQDEVYALVHRSVADHGGSISAEHGVGQLKRDELPRYKDGIELALMKRIKAALDPAGLFNPGKVLQP